jgi:hypothetical protein
MAKRKGDLAPIYARITVNGKRSEIKTVARVLIFSQDFVSFIYGIIKTTHFGR